MVLVRFTLIGKDINFPEIYGDKICQTDHFFTVLLDKGTSLFVFIIFLAIIFSLSESKVIKGLWQFIVITIYWFKKLTRSPLFCFFKVKSVNN